MGELVPCRFFARGSCKFGDNCRFYHGSYGSNTSPTYVPFTTYSTQPYGDNAYSYTPSPYADESLISLQKIVRADMEEWENFQIWPFSCYGPMGGRPNVPGIEDLSEEEIRWAYLTNGKNFPPYLQLAHRFEETVKARVNYMQLNQENMNILRALCEAENTMELPIAFPAANAPNTQSSFGNEFIRGAGAGTAIQSFNFTVPSTPTMEVYEISPSPVVGTFGQNQQSTEVQSTGIFGSPSFTPFKLETSKSEGSVGGNFEKPFQQEAVMNPWINSVIQPGGGGGIPTQILTLKNIDHLVYSLETNLTQEEIAAFKAVEFSSFVPLNPPCKSFCFM